MSLVLNGTTGVTLDSLTLGRGGGNIATNTALGVSALQSNTTQDWTGCVSRNKEHLQLMLTSPYWTAEDLTPLRDAVQ